MNVGGGGGGGIPGPGGKIPPGIAGGPAQVNNPHPYPQSQVYPHTYPAYHEADAPHPGPPLPRQTPAYPGYHDPPPQPAHGYQTFHPDADVGGHGGYSSGGGGTGGGGHSVPIPLGSLDDRLRVAASKGLVDKVHELLQAGAGFQPDREGRTALHFAAQAGHAEVCKLIVQKGCELNLQDTMGYTALLRACSQGLLEVVKVCLEGGCAVDFADENGNTALHEAAWHGFSKTVELLIRYNADVFRTNKSGFTSLHLAAQNGHNETSRVLLYGGINPDLQNNYGDTALHTAARYGHAGVSRILISAKCKLNVQNKNGDTALHIAAALKRRKIAKILVESHIDVHIKNKQNETAADVARRKEHPEIILIITSLSRPHSTGPRGVKEVPGVSFKDDIEIEDGPVVCADDEPPAKPEKQEKEKRFFQFFKKKKKDKEKDAKPSPVPPTQVKKPVPPGKVQPVPARPVSGFFSQYVPKQGTQYYRDLAGNVKQGPVGYTPLCQCQPTIHHIEKTMYQTKEELYDHIDASHQVLSDRLAQLDMRASQQVHALDHLTRERLAQERDACRQAIEDRLQRERHRTQYVVESYGDEMQGHIHTWLEDRLAEYGHCLDHHHDDLALPPRHIFTDVNIGPDGGRLFRSRSDETLSVSDYSGKGRKRDFYASRKAAMEQIRGWKVPGGNAAALPVAGGPGGVKVTGRRAERERGRSTDNVGGRDGRESRGPGQTVEESKTVNLNSVSGAIGGGGAMVRTTMVGASSHKIVTAAEVHKPGLGDRLADGASPLRMEGDSLQVRPQQERHVVFSAGPGFQGVQPSQGAVPKRSSSTQFHQLPPGRPDSAHFQGQPHQARSHGNLASQTPQKVTLATFGPSQNLSSPRRSILRSKTDEGALQERSMSASRSPLSPSSAQLSQANLEGRGPLGENIGLDLSGLHHPRGDPYNETTQATPAAGRLPGASGGATAISLSKAGGSGGGAVSGGNFHYQHNPLYGTAQSVGDIVKQWSAVESESLRSRPRTRSTDAVLHNTDEDGVKFRSHSEERVLDRADKGADLSGSKRADLSGYVTDSAVRPSYVDNANQRYGYNNYDNNSGAVSYRPVPPKRSSQYVVNNTSLKSDGSSPQTALSSDRLDTRPAAAEFDQSHRPSSSERQRQSGYYTDSDLRQSGHYTDSDLRQGVAGNYFQKNAVSSFKAQDQLVSSSRQAATRYRVLPPLPPGATAERTYPKVPPKPTLGGSSAMGQHNVYEQSRPSSAGGQTSYDRSMSPSTHQLSYDRSKSPAVGNQPVFDRTRSQTPTGRDSSAAVVGRSGLPGRGFSQASQGQSAPGQITQPAALGSQSYGQYSKPPAWSVVDSPRDRPGSSGSGGGQQSLRTQSPYQTVAGGVQPTFSKPETSTTGRTDTAPQTAIPSGHYSVANGCLQHDTYTYSPTACSSGGGGKEDSTCSSNQDSGYSGRMAPGRGSVGGRSGGDSAANTPSSSFSTDRSLSLGTPGNSHAGSPYLHLGAGGREGNSYTDYVPMGSTSSGGSNPQDDHLRSSLQPTPPQYPGSFKGYVPDNSYNTAASLPPAVYARTSTAGNAAPSPPDYQKTLFKSGPSDFPSANIQHQSGTTPSTSANQGVDDSSAGGYSSHAGFYGNGSGSYGNAGNVQKQVQGWYQQKLLEAAQRLRNSSQYSAQPYGDNGALQDSAGYSGLAYSGTSLPIHYDPVHGSDV